MLDRIWFWLLFVGIAYLFCKSAYLTAVGQNPHADAQQAAVAVEQNQVEQDQVEQDQVEQEQPDAAPTANPLKQAGKKLTDAALDAASLSVDLCLILAGIMILWLGILQVAKDAGMVDALAYALRPILRWLFPDVPDGHPAQGAILMNMSANMLGLDNAATPFGVKAMKELQELNPHKEQASNSMATFLAINTSSVTLVPITVIGLRAAAGSDDPAGPLFGILLATTASTIAAIIAVRWLSKFPRFAGAEGKSEPVNPSSSDNETQS